MRVSQVAPSVESNLNEVGTLIDLMKSGGAGLSDTQSQRLVGYLGTLEEMRSQIGVMCSFYESDDKVLSILTLLMDRIDDSLQLVQRSSDGMQVFNSISLLLQ